MDKHAGNIAAAAAFAAVLIIGLTAQEPGFRGRELQPPKPSTAYTVGGIRHGISYFPRAGYDFTKPKAAGVMDFSHYHTYGEVTAFLRQWAADYPNLVDLYSVGKTFEDRDIWQITITNKATGKDTDKPAMFIEGNRHSGEVTAAESALWFAWHILTGYGHDPALTKLVDTKALYVRVKNNPDGSELYLNTAQSNRSTVRPYDDDRDTLLDEDPPEDLDGDGLILQVRKKVEPGKGTMTIDPADPSGRLMMRAPAGKGDYIVSAEGIDNDADGRTNEDGIGGLDLHRNYPENWRPMPGLDATGRGYTQGGAGAYPLSEPETRAVFTFLLEHPNVSVGQTMDTTVPMLLHGPSTSRMSESMFPEDMKIYQYFDTEGKRDHRLRERRGHVLGLRQPGPRRPRHAGQGRGDGLRDPQRAPGAASLRPLPRFRLPLLRRGLVRGRALERRPGQGLRRRRPRDRPREASATSTRSSAAAISSPGPSSTTRRSARSRSAASIPSSGGRTRRSRSSRNGSRKRPCSTSCWPGPCPRSRSSRPR